MLRAVVSASPSIQFLSLQPISISLRVVLVSAPERKPFFEHRECRNVDLKDGVLCVTNEFALLGSASS